MTNRCAILRMKCSSFKYWNQWKMWKKTATTCIVFTKTILFLLMFEIDNFFFHRNISISFLFQMICSWCSRTFNPSVLFLVYLAFFYFNLLNSWDYVYQTITKEIEKKKYSHSGNMNEKNTNTHIHTYIYI